MFIATSLGSTDVGFATKLLFPLGDYHKRLKGCRRFAPASKPLRGPSRAPGLNEVDSNATREAQGRHRAARGSRRHPCRGCRPVGTRVMAGRGEGGGALGWAAAEPAGKTSRPGPTSNLARGAAVPGQDPSDSRRIAESRSAALRFGAIRATLGRRQNPVRGGAAE